ncbi:uncharacterized protein JCM15063_003286 [Sporobolomyces koalae]|uniref:uncharacterized protein n=1 Tax=Sporobolomyces koalae TaxID=500713 RepID=UPI003175E119
MTKFVTREVVIPDHLLAQDGDPEQVGAIPSNWDEPPMSGPSSSKPSLYTPTGTNRVDKANGDALAMSSPLLDQNFHKPMPVPHTNRSNARDEVPLTSGRIRTTSLSLQRPGPSTPALPSIPNHSPLDLLDPPSQRHFQQPGFEGFSTARTSAPSSPALSSNVTWSGDASGSSYHLPTNPTPSLESFTTGGSASSKRSMFRSFAFGKSRNPNNSSPNTSGPSTPQLSRPVQSSDPSTDSQQHVQQFGAFPDPPIVSAPTPPKTTLPPGLSTVSHPGFVNARNDSNPRTLARRPSRQELATGSLRDRRSYAAREADQWLLDAQVAGLGIPAPSVDELQGIVDRQDAEESADLDDEEDDDDLWADRGEQYTRDLQRARKDDPDHLDEDGIPSYTEPDTVLEEDDAESETGGAQFAVARSPDHEEVGEAFHDARQSPEVARTFALALSDSPQTSPTQAIAPIYRTGSANPDALSFDENSDQSSPFRRDGKLSLPIYSNAPLDGTFNDSSRRRNRSDGADLNEIEQDELTRRLNGFALEPEPVAESLADFVVAVVGPRNVGKSAVVKRGLKPRSTEPPIVIQEDHVGNRVTTTTTSFTIGGSRRTIEVLEIDMHLLRYNDEGVIWPDGLPQCEGAMLCYDSTDPDALSSLAILLKSFWTRGSDVPLIVLACKALAPHQGKNATDPTEAAKVCNIYGAGIVTLDGGLEDPTRKTKESFKYIIRQIMENRGELYRPASVASESPSQSRRGSAHYTTTSRSPFITGTFSTNPPSELPTGPEDSQARHPQQLYSSQEDHFVSGRQSRQDGLGLGFSVVREAPIVSEDKPESPVAAFSSLRAGEPTRDVRTLQVPTSSTDAVPTFTASQGASDMSQKLEAAEVISTPEFAAVDPSRRLSAKPAPLDLFFTRDDMIDKFLFASVTGSDEAYVTLFLITYRRFARPFDVLEKLIERFDFVAKKLKSDPLLSRFAQMKICGTLSIWMQSYPGDFSAPSTYGLLSPFLHSLLPNGATWVAHYALELIPLLPAISSQPDADSSWALPDKDVEALPVRPSPADSPSDSRSRRPSMAPSYDSAASRDQTDRAATLSIPPVYDGSSALPPSFSPRPASDAGTFDTQDSGDHSQGLSASASSSLRPRISAGAFGLIEVSNMVMDMREEEVALQITRLTWEMFGGMTPRDLLRHVLAPRDPANPRVALRDSDTNVMRSIAFVNYLANWTATLILVQSKLKQRARIMEKMLLVALALREQENFDSLMGVLAGLNSQPIFRLTETMDLVTNKVDGDVRTQPRRSEATEAEKNRLPKKLRSLNRLMAATKSFSAYRLALANSGVNMIPYLGVHLQDITVANEIKSDLRDGKVNWSKFSQMGRSAAVVLDCAKIAPALPIDKLVERCVVGIPVLDEERQYTLSYQHQPRQSDKPGGTRSRLRDLAKSTFATAS